MFPLLRALLKVAFLVSIFGRVASPLIPSDGDALWLESFTYGGLGAKRADLSADGPAARDPPTQMTVSRGPSRQLVSTLLNSEDAQLASLDYSQKFHGPVASRSEKDCKGPRAPVESQVSGHRGHSQLPHGEYFPALLQAETCDALWPRNYVQHSWTRAEPRDDDLHVCDADPLWPLRALWRHWRARPLPEPPGTKTIAFFDGHDDMTSDEEAVLVLLRWVSWISSDSLCWHPCSIRTWSIPHSRSTSTSVSELYYLRHCRSAAALAAGSKSSSSAKWPGARSSVSEALPTLMRTFLKVGDDLGHDLSWPITLLPRPLSEPLALLALSTIIWSHGEVQVLATAALAMVAMDVHIPQPACSILTTLTAWVLLTGSPLGGHLALAGCIGILRPAFPAAPGTPWGGERDRADGRVRTPPRDWAKRNRLNPIAEVITAAREQHRFFQASSTSVDEGAGQSSGLSQEMQGLDLATRRTRPSSPISRAEQTRRSSRSPRRLPDENSRVRSASTPPTTRPTSSTISIMRLSTPPGTGSPEQLPDSQESCFSFGCLPASWHSHDLHLPESVAASSAGQSGTQEVREAPAQAESMTALDSLTSDASVEESALMNPASAGAAVNTDAAEPILPRPLIAGGPSSGGPSSGIIAQVCPAGAFRSMGGSADTQAIPSVGAAAFSTTVQNFQAPPPASSPMVTRLSCPFCSQYSTTGPARGLMIHITCKHQGSVIDERARMVLSAIDRAVCPEDGCGSMRMWTSRKCSNPRCCSSRPPRPIVVGDVIGGLQTQSEPVAEGDASIAVNHNCRRARSRTANRGRTPLPVGPLPDDFIARVRALSPSTILHIPVEFRARLCTIAAATLEGLVGGDERASKLEEARSKLLLGHCRKGANLRVELSTRLLTWFRGDFEALLIRAEESHRNRVSSARRDRSCAKEAQTKRRARRMAKDGAYSKGVSTLCTEVADLTGEDQAMWAATLLPRSAQPETACADPGAGHLHAAGQTAGTDSATPMPPGAAKFRHALAGIRFPALSAPGPSGMRPEHLKEFLAIRQRTVANRMYRAIDALRRAGENGELSESARWILASRLVFIKKKKGPAPRPIRVGELWRRVIAKGITSDHKSRIQSFMLKLRQMGVAIPGGAEALIHLRAVAEEVMSSADAVAILDLDFKNAFPSFEWCSIRESVANHFPSILPWCAWCHAQPSVVYLPSGGVAFVDRGAEQGDPLGSLYCALVLADVASRTRAAMTQELQNEGIQCNAPFLDAWYMDDGEVFCKPAFVELFLRILDLEAAKVGATRGSGPDVKSTARLCGSTSSIDAIGDTWVSDYIRRTCKVGRPNVPVEVLGAELHRLREQFSDITDRVGAIHDAISSLDHVSTELVLTRFCADVCKVTYLLRVAGPSMDDDLLDKYDKQGRSSMERILGGPLHDAAWEQGAAGVREGGLGLRRAKDLALPAFVASRIETRPLVELLAHELIAAGMIPGEFLSLYEQQTSSTFDRFVARLSEEGRSRAAQGMSEALSAARDRLKEMQGHTRIERPDGDITSANALVFPAGAEDPEYGSLENQGLQHIFASILDDERMDSLSEHLLATEQWESARRIHELRDPSVSHGWLWALNPAHGALIKNSLFLICIRLRVGFHFLDEPMLCPKCNNAVLDRACAHALCCANAESTKGHNRIRDSLLQLVSLADGSATTEVPDLIPSAPRLRPADIFTQAAVPGCQAALDVGVMSPDATGAGNDCCEAMFQKKLAYYGPHLTELEEQDVRYIPLAFSSYGRVHPESAATIKSIAQRAARRKGLASYQGILRRAMSGVGVQLWKRAASMILTCLPRETPEEIAALFGDVDIESDTTSDSSSDDEDRLFGADQARSASSADEGDAVSELGLQMDTD